MSGTKSPMHVPTPHRTRAMFVRVGCAAAAALLLAILIGAAALSIVYSRAKPYLALINAPTVRFVLPDGFTGMFVVRYPDQARGEAANAAFVQSAPDGVWEIHVPPNGEAILTDMRLLRDWHQTQARYASGTTLPVAVEVPSPNSTPPDTTTVSLWHGATTTDGSTWFLVGTARDKQWELQNWRDVKPGPIVQAEGDDR